LVNTTTRFLGYRIGLVEKRLLLHFKKRVTRNKGFWKGQTSQSS
jgi:hypothetical protein